MDRTDFERIPEKERGKRKGEPWGGRKGFKDRDLKGFTGCVRAKVCVTLQCELRCSIRCSVYLV